MIIQPDEETSGGVGRVRIFDYLPLQAKNLGTIINPHQSYIHLYCFSKVGGLAHFCGIFRNSIRSISRPCSSSPPPPPRPHFQFCIWIFHNETGLSQTFSLWSLKKTRRRALRGMWMGVGGEGIMKIETKHARRSHAAPLDCSADVTWLHARTQIKAYQNITPRFALWMRESMHDTLYERNCTFGKKMKDEGKLWHKQNVFFFAQ